MESYILLIFWLGAAPVGIGAGQYETFATRESCDAKLVVELQKLIQVERYKKNPSLPVMRCLSI